jgi:SET domain-containing protein
MPMPRKSYEPGKFDLAVRRARTGLGLFAAGPIPKGACIIEYTGKLLTKEEYKASNSRYLWDIGPGKTLDGSPRSNRARYINHSCKPNCEPDVYKRRVYIYAKRNIEPGEELAYNYGKDYFDEYIGKNCRCLKCMPEAPAKAVKAIAKAKPAKSKTAKPGKPKAEPKTAPRPTPVPRPIPRQQPVVAAPTQEQRRKAA